jgi:hypothetical protein
MASMGSQVAAAAGQNAEPEPFRTSSPRCIFCGSDFAASVKLAVGQVLDIGGVVNLSWVRHRCKRPTCQAVHFPSYAIMPLKSAAAAESRVGSDGTLI